MPSIHIKLLLFWLKKPVCYKGVGKRRDGDDFSSRPPFSKKGKSGMFEASTKKGIVAVLFLQQSSGRVMARQTHLRANPSGGD